MVKRVPRRRNKVKPGKKKPKKGTTNATGRSYEYQRKYNARKAEKLRRAELNRENRKRGTYGNGDKLDVSHKDGKVVGLESQKTNRARNGKGSTRRGRNS